MVIDHLLTRMILQVLAVPHHVRSQVADLATELKNADTSGAAATNTPKVRLSLPGDVSCGSEIDGCDEIDILDLYTPPSQDA